MRLTKLIDGLLGLAVAMLILARTSGAVPAAFNVQGRLADTQGRNRNGAYDVRFTIYDADTGGTALWTKTVSSLPVRGGTFQAILGDIPGQPPLAQVFTAAFPYLEIQVLAGPGVSSPESPMVPRQALVSVPFAFGAAAVVSGGPATVGAGGQERFRVAANGNVGVGTADPTAKLHVAGVAGTDGVRFPDGTLQTRAAGIVYTRWGRTVCPSGATLVYAGYVGAGHHSHPGGGGTLCLSDAPTWEDFDDANHDGALLYGTEYETRAGGVARLEGLYNYQARCAVCHRADASSFFMLPGSQTCPQGWTAEYAGYLMATAHNNSGSPGFSCVDRAAEPTGNPANQDNNLWYPTEFECDGGLPCPPYVNNREATCAVCSRR